MCCKDSANEGNDKEKACLFLGRSRVQPIFLPTGKKCKRGERQRKSLSFSWAFPSAAYLLADRQKVQTRGTTKKKLVFFLGRSRVQPIFLPTGKAYSSALPLWLVPSAHKRKRRSTYTHSPTLHEDRSHNKDRWPPFAGR